MPARLERKNTFIRFQSLRVNRLNAPGERFLVHSNFWGIKPAKIAYSDKNGSVLTFEV